MEELNNEIKSNGLKCEQIKEEEKIVSKRFYCYECNFLFSQKSLLDTHMEKHCQFHCPNCEYTTYAEDEFKNHKQSDECGELFHCSKCNFTSNRKEYLSKHERKHTRPYACEECAKTFTQELYLKAHFAKVHMKRKYFACNEDKCSFTTDYKSGLINHERSHTKPFLCSDCGKRFTHAKNRDNHFLKDHKNFTELPALEHTMQDSNNNEKDYSISVERKNYTCASCAHNFKNHLHLKWHLLTHGNEKYFSCSKCKYKTKSSNHFKSHVKKHIRKHIGSQETANGILLENDIKLHKKENKNQKNDTIKEEIEAEPLSCSVCYFKSMYKEVIQEHINTCHGVHAYICKICSYAANSESMLKSHMVTHENNMQNSTVSLDSYNEESNNNYIVINKEDNTKSEEKSIYTCTKCGHNFDFLLHLKWHLLIHGDEKYFSCSECEYKTKNTYNFKKHSKQHIGKLLACQECNYTTEDILLLLNHMKNHDESAFFSCNEDNCSFTTNHKSSLINHERSHTRPFLCRACGKGFTHEKIRDNHFLNDHRNVSYKQIDSEPEPLSCSVCEFKCTSKTDFHDHINDHHLKPAFICEICSYEVNSESMLKSHMVTHENNNAFESSVALKKLASEKKTYTCSTCRQNFNSNLHLKWHLLTHGDEKYFGCSECEYKTKRVYNFESHSKRHIGKLIACQECNYTTEDEILLVKHMKIHKKEKKKLDKRKYKNFKQKCELSFICSYCSVECSSIKKLTRHIQNHDNSDLKKDPIGELQNCPAKIIEKCNISEQTNDTKLSEELVAWNNMEITNARENVIKTFSCGINGCEESFSSLGNLKEHIDIHKGEKVYNCNDCNYKCYTNHELEKHEYTHREHPLIEHDISANNMKQFDIYKTTVSSTNDTCTVVRKRCPKCKIWFSSKSDLARHLKSHTLHKMFTCNLCNYKDKRLYNVVIHKEKVHGQLSRLKCDMCSFKSCVLKRLEAHKLSHNSQTKIESKDANSEVQEKKHLISYGNMDSVHRIPTKKNSIKSKILSSVFNKNKKNKISKSKTVNNLNKNKACSLCDSAFMARSGFCKHMYTHSKEKRWSCLLCPFKTHWAFSLKQHRRKMHNNENI